jgi:glycosyltransferase involved in cell wall biosynthesis
LLGQAQIAVVVPAYNEARHIASTLRSVPAFVDRIVVVDDGSGDRTAEIAAMVADARIEVLRHAQNRGVGAALKSGYVRAFDAGAEIVAVMAGDGQMHPDDLRALLEPVLSGAADYVKGDRLSHPDASARMPKTRLAGNHMLSALTRLCVGVPVRDSQCGYTALGRRGLARIRLHELWDGYGYPNDLLGLLHASGAEVRDIVVRPVYGDESSGIGLRHALLVIPLLLARIALRRLIYRKGPGPSRPLGEAQRDPPSSAWELRSPLVAKRRFTPQSVAETALTAE